MFFPGESYQTRDSASNCFCETKVDHIYRVEFCAIDHGFPMVLLHSFCVFLSGEREADIHTLAGCGLAGWWLAGRTDGLSLSRVVCAV